MSKNMKTKEEHKIGDSFARSLKIVAMDVIQWPLIAEDVREILYHGRELLVEAVVAPTIRILALVLFPISVPLLAYLCRKDVQRTEEWRKNIRSEIHKIKGQQ